MNKKAGSSEDVVKWILFLSLLLVIAAALMKLINVW